MQLLIAGLAYDINADAVKLCTSYSNIKIPFFPFSISSQKVEMKGYLSNQCTFSRNSHGKNPYETLQFRKSNEEYKRVPAASKAVKNGGKARKREKLLLRCSVEVVETGARPHSELHFWLVFYRNQALVVCMTH